MVLESEIQIRSRKGKKVSGPTPCSEWIQQPEVSEPTPCSE